MTKNSGARFSNELKQAQDKKFARRDKYSNIFLFAVSVWAIIVLTALKVAAL